MRGMNIRSISEALKIRKKIRIVTLMVTVLVFALLAQMVVSRGEKKTVAEETQCIIEHNDGDTVKVYNQNITKPMGIAIDSLGNKWIANSTGNTVTKIKPDDSYEVFSGFSTPYYIAIDQKDNVWVTNSSFVAKIVPTAKPGDSLVKYGSWALNRPISLAIDPDDNIWLTHKSLVNYSGTIVTPGYITKIERKFDGNGNEINPEISTINNSSFSSSPGFRSLYGIAVDSNFTVWVTDSSGNQVVKIYSEEGSLRFKKFATDFSDPRGITIDSLGNKWVANYGTGTVQSPGHIVKIY